MQEVLLYQVQHIENPSCPTIPIIKWMYAFELVVYDRHFYQWIPFAQCLIIDEVHKVSHQILYLLMALWRRVNSLIGSRIFQSGSR